LSNSDLRSLDLAAGEPGFRQSTHVFYRAIGNTRAAQDSRYDSRLEYDRLCDEWDRFASHQSVPDMLRVDIERNESPPFLRFE
jgi:hypothetical protein